MLIWFQWETITPDCYFTKESDECLLFDTYFIMYFLPQDRAPRELLAKKIEFIYNYG